MTRLLIPYLLSHLIQRVSLEVMEDGVTPKSTTESWNDNLPKLYIHSSAFMKVLGGTLDVDFNAETGQLTPKLIDREGHEIDPNAWRDNKLERNRYTIIKMINSSIIYVSVCFAKAGRWTMFVWGCVQLSIPFDSTQCRFSNPWGMMWPGSNGIRHSQFSFVYTWINDTLKQKCSTKNAPPVVLSRHASINIQFSLFDDNLASISSHRHGYK